eukprot:m.269208 g.269208  ORF g.269208 m.269208 type:complete len:175 (+) comp41015_c0_seq1:446-970(+)
MSGGADQYLAQGQEMLQDNGFLFKVANNAALVPWLLLILLPRSRLTQLITHSFMFTLLLAPLYLFLVVENKIWEADFSSLDGVLALFKQPPFAVAGWLHYIVFDLFVGAWIARDSYQASISHVWIIPCLVLTLICGPVGLLLYFVVRTLFGATSSGFFKFASFSPAVSTSKKNK